MAILARKMVDSTPRLPVMTGFVERRMGPEKVWRRRGIYALLAFVCFVYSFFIALFPRALILPLLMPLLVIVMMIVWALPLGRKPPGKSINTLFWCYTVTLILWPNYLAVEIPGLPWITAARLFAAPVAWLLLIYTSTSEPFRKDMKERLGAARPLTIMVSAFAVIQVVAIAFSSYPIISVNRVFNNQITWIGMFFAAVWVLRDPRAIERWIIAYIAMAAILGLIAIREAQIERLLWADSIPSFLQIEDESVQRILAGSRRLTGQYRVTTTATTPLSFAELMAMCVPLLMYMIQRYPKVWVIAACVAIDGLILNSLILTDARLGFVGFIAGHVLYLAYFVINRRRTNPNSLFNAALMAMLPFFAAFTAAAVLFVGSIRVRVLGGGQHSFSTQARFDQMDLAFVKIWESPLFGFGAGGGGGKLGYTNLAGTLTIDSYYLSILMDYGFIGFFAYYGMFLYAIFVSARLAFTSREAPTRALAAVAAIFLTEFVIIKSVLSQAANHPLVFIVLGAVVTIAYTARQENAAPKFPASA